MVGQSTPSTDLEMMQNWEWWLIDEIDECAVIQIDCNRLEKWTNRGVLTFHKRKYQVLHQERTIQRQQYMLGTSWMESIFAKRTWYSWSINDMN